MIWTEKMKVPKFQIIKEKERGRLDPSKQKSSKCKNEKKGNLKIIILHFDKVKFSKQLISISIFSVF